jgi:GTP-binding protein
MWVDEIELTLRSGKGGDGIVSFRREKGIEFGGPDGGRGGDGGAVVFVARASARSLASLRGRRQVRAGLGENGGPNNCSGRSGDPVTVEVPPGTVILREDGSVVADLFKAGDSCEVLAGGRGGRGNSGFASGVEKAPRHRELGEKGRVMMVRLELRLIADVGLVGLPNAGKSTLLSRLSAARPRIADYPFTTLEPMLGVVERGDVVFTLADLPGLIRGAHAGKGLGIQFLRHVERTRVVLHLVDGTAEDPLDDYQAIREELAAYGRGLDEKRSIVAVTKADALAPDQQSPIPGAFLISSSSGQGLDELCRAVGALLESIPPPEPLPSELVDEEEDLPVAVSRDENGFLLEGDAVRRYLERRAPGDSAAWRRFWRTLKRWGVADELKRLGVKDGDVVRVGDWELEYIDED